MVAAVVPLTLVALASAALAAGCGANNAGGTPSPVDDDGGTDVCVSVQAQSFCPADWESAKVQVDCSLRDVQMEEIGLGDDGTYLVRSDRFLGNQEFFCVYDRTSHALVGALRRSGADDFCGGTSAQAQSGVATWDLWEKDFSLLGPGPQCPGHGKCHAALSTSSCEPIWEEAETTVSCTPGNLGVLGRAGGYLARGTTGTRAPLACYYDPLTHALVAAWANNSVSPEYCNGTSFDVLYGDLDQGLSIKADASVPPCTIDGGADAAGDADARIDPDATNNAG